MFNTLTSADKRKSLQLSEMETLGSTETLSASKRAAELLMQHVQKGAPLNLWPTPLFLFLFFREAVLLGPSSTAVQRAGAGGRGGPCQQADGQVCRKVSA